MYQSLNEQGKMAVVLDTGAVSRGSGRNSKERERDIRKFFVDQDLVEGVILLPENLFVNTSAPAVILIINKAKQQKEEILLINASKFYEKGRPKNHLTEQYANEVADLYLHWEEKDNISKSVNKKEIVDNDYNLTPSRYINEAEDPENNVLPLESAYKNLKNAENEREEIDSELKQVFEQLGLN
jgi:type I restriction enzyme M protein